MNKKGFLKEFFKQRREVGAISASSKFLGRRMCNPIKFKNANHIIELGPGTGVFTKQLLKRMNPDATLFVFETNKSFYQFLMETIDDKRMVLINDTAENIHHHLKKYNLEEVDYIVSSLPLTVIPVHIKENILDEAHKCLKIGGLYIQFQYSLNALGLLKRKFDKKVKIDFAPINFPPAFVYRCIR